MVSGHPKSTGISRVDGLLTGPPDLGRHKLGLVFFMTIVAEVVNLMLVNHSNWTSIAQVMIHLIYVIVTT